MCVSRQAERRPGHRREAEVVACRDDQWLTSGRLLDLLKHAEQRNVIAAELATVGRHAVVLVVDCVGCHGQLMRHRR
jgi:hypothetical protein